MTKKRNGMKNFYPSLEDVARVKEFNVNECVAFDPKKHSHQVDVEHITDEEFEEIFADEPKYGDERE